MPRGVYNRNKGAADAAPVSPPETGKVGPVTEVAPNETTKTVAMELLKNYVPRKLVSILGHKQEAVIVKGPDGKMREESPEKWIDGEMKPAPYPGVGFDEKIWAGTVIEVPEAEAREMRAKKIGEAYL